MPPASSADVQRLADALAALPADERAAVVAHVRAMAGMSAKRRAALLALTDPLE